jgi:hypothetical protein
LYPTAVVDLKYSDLDSAVYNLLRSILQLPYGTPTALLFAELRILPSQMQAYQRALRQMWRFVNQCYFYPYFIEPALTTPGGVCDLFAKGPFARLKRMLHQTIGYHGKTSRGLPRHSRLADILFEGVKPAGEALTDAELLPAITSITYPVRRSRVERAIWMWFEHWVEEELQGLPECYQPQLARLLRHSGKKLPRYLSLGGDRARIGLRFKIPYLRYYHDRAEPLPDCLWCGGARCEGPLHLLACAHQPASVRLAVEAAFGAISRESGLSLDRHQHAIRKAYINVAWRNQSQAAVTEVLGSMAHIINRYRQELAVDGQGRRPILAVRTFHVASRVDVEVGA